MPELDGFIKELKKLLSHEIDCVRRLLGHFDIEKNALACLDDNEITLNSEKKQELIDTLQQASGKRLNWMAQHGLPVNADGTHPRIDTPDNELELDALFDELYELANQCVTENRHIGQLINRRSQFLTQTLNRLLTGSASSELTYQANGQSEQHKKSQPLITI